MFAVVSSHISFFVMSIMEDTVQNQDAGVHSLLLDQDSNDQQDFVERMNSDSSTKWNVMGSKVPRKEVVFFCQMLVLYTVIITCIINLSVGSGKQTELWIILLSTCLGAALPNPRMEDSKTITDRFTPYVSRQPA